MIFHRKRGSIYINLPSGLYDVIRHLGNTNNQINISLLALLMHFILKDMIKAEDNEGGSKHTALCSSILRKYDFQKKGIRYISKHHLDFLEEHGIIKSLPHINNIQGKENSCKRYKINEKYLYENNEPIEVEIIEKALSIKIRKHELESEMIANDSTAHLTKWLSDEKFNLNNTEGIEFVEKNYHQESSKGFKRKMAIAGFKTQSYSRDGKDNRLHSIFTSLPKNLRGFVDYDGESLIGFDIKSSQPFILSFLLKIIMMEYNLELEENGKIIYKSLAKRLYQRITKLVNKDNHISNTNIKDISNSITTMLLTMGEPPDFTEFFDFINLVRNGDIYMVVGKWLLANKSVKEKNGIYYASIYDKKTHCIITKDFKTLRDCAKLATLISFYSSSASKLPVVRDFGKRFPMITKLMDAIKKDNKSHFAILMQRIEAKCVLDFCAIKIALKHPQMPLISIHDSLCTTESYAQELKIEFERLLEDYFGCYVNVGTDKWGD